MHIYTGRKSEKVLEVVANFPCAMLYGKLRKLRKGIIMERILEVSIPMSSLKESLRFYFAKKKRNLKYQTLKANLHGESVRCIGT